MRFAQDTGKATGWYNASYDPETANIKEQIENSRDELNAMDVVESVTVPTKFKNKKEAANWAIDLLKSTGYQIDRQGFGKIYFNAADIRYAANYADSNAEKAALAALPKVLKRGIQVGEHGNHKQRKKATVTFAAPVELNGIRGNMGIVVNVRDGHYYTHRIILPDGKAFTFTDTKKGTTQESHQGVPENRSLADATSVVPDTNIAESDPSVKLATQSNGQSSIGLSYDDLVRHVRERYPQGAGVPTDGILRSTSPQNDRAGEDGWMDAGPRADSGRAEKDMEGSKISRASVRAHAKGDGSDPPLPLEHGVCAQAEGERAAGRLGAVEGHEHGHRSDVRLCRISGGEDPV